MALEPASDLKALVFFGLQQIIHIFLLSINDVYFSHECDFYIFMATCLLAGGSIRIKMFSCQGEIDFRTTRRSNLKAQRNY